jgi:hypothetical protein
MFFTDPATGHRHGYYDGVDADGLFEYVGEGQRGDQTFTQGNKTILNHQEDGRTLEGFVAAGARVAYLGEFDLVDTYKRDAHEADNEDVLRQVIVFRLRPLNELPVSLPAAPITPSDKPTVETVSVEERHTERGFVTPQREPYPFERTESDLVVRYLRYLMSQGHTVGRLRVVPPGETAPIYSDLWVETDAELVEAKGLVTREQMRQAVGQLIDYGRFVDARSRTVLVPERPRQDLLEYLSVARVDVVFPNQDGTWTRVPAA